MQGVDYRALALRLLRAGGYTTVTLAKEIGLSQAAVSRLSTGKQSTVTADAALRLIRLAGGTVELPADEPTAEQAAA
jgi:plasmid maintenance system antidote protein VapI